MIFFDLDGTILDVSNRYYGIYRDVLMDAGYRVLNKQEYWAAKRKKILERDILKKTKAEDFYDEYQDKRLSLIEDPRYLTYDTVHHGAIQVLERLSGKHVLVLVTLRRSRTNLDRQLVELGLKRFFNQVVSSEYKANPSWKIKYDLIKEILTMEEIANHFLVGDTETDIIAGNRLGFTTVAVSTGLRTKHFLQESNPDIICKSIKDILKIEVDHK